MRQWAAVRVGCPVMTQVFILMLAACYLRNVLNVTSLLGVIPILVVIVIIICASYFIKIIIGPGMTKLVTLIIIVLTQVFILTKLIILIIIALIFLILIIIFEIVSILIINKSSLCAATAVAAGCGGSEGCRLAPPPGQGELRGKEDARMRVGQWWASSWLERGLGESLLSGLSPEVSA